MQAVPTCTTTIIPTATQDNVPVNLRFEWNAAARASGYFISIGTSENTEDILTRTDVNNTTTYLPSNLLPFRTELFVKIIPYNGIGEAQDCESIRFITEDEPFVAPKTLKGFSPNGDGINDRWEIANIEDYPQNEVYIYNRWGSLVFKTKGYDNKENIFKGIANQGTNIGADELPEGTYFYQVINVPSGAIDRPKGMVIIKR
ncbi:gliding motility-associated C-terminal domain-containing protein [Aquimarina sp. ERC-38]|uniref:gliding motility-associated C-terminal domain-containing protein n=1 Tax=Aquimarina sp. ERC-38 TaxID=2949996 RepID=UPI002246EEC8|nr:gliding motility-associated C-terminal domain-containing protein [Aquimarina sp. ERC-38]UZO80434.1 gliding motility-associated C-terminal domain-containing protein [Aquimarina sp. ERC-38]